MAVTAQRLEVAFPRRTSIGLTTPRTARVPFALLAIVVVGLMLLGLVTAQTLVTQDSFRLAELSSRAESLERDFGRLRLRAAELSSPERLQQAARRAGMVLPERVELLPVPAQRGPAKPNPNGSLAIEAALGGGG